MWRMLGKAVVVAAAALAAAPGLGEHRKVVDGLAIDVGVVPATQLLRNDAYERAMHRDAAGGATHHVVVAISEANSKAPVDDARVTLELTDPRGGVQRGTLDRGNAGGMPDYSGLFRFGWAGTYRMKVTVARAGAAPVASTFSWTQASY